jgi:hypothetical protein
VHPAERYKRAVRGNRRLIAVLAAAAALVAFATASIVLHPEAPVAMGSPSIAPPITIVPRILYAHHVVLDTVPGGGAVTTDAYDSFEIETAGRARQTHAIAGVARGMPIFDGHGRVAYWRVPSMTRSLEIAGPVELVVWDIQTDRDRVLLTLRDEGPGGTLLWSADGKSIALTTRARPATGRDTLARLLVIDADSGATRVLGAPAVQPVAPIFADAQIVAGVRGGSYVVLDAITGAVRTQTALRVPTTFLVESTELSSSPDGTVLELHHRFESEAGPLWIWSVQDPALDIAKVDARGISEPTFWPGRTEVVFTGPAGVSAVDYRTGRTRTLVSPPGVTFVVAIESGGRFALVRRGAGLEIVERVDDELRVRPDLQLIVGSRLSPLGIVIP